MSNFRNYERLELDLEPGLVLVHGGNGQGKSNLLEALYTLAIAKSPRASADRELVRWHSNGETYSQIAATAQRDGGQVRVQIDLRSGPATATDGSSEQQANGAAQGEPGMPPAMSVEKYVRVNGVPRRASELVGEINAVMFSAQDMDIALGSPTVRRRYLDILIAQLDARYLRALQKYQRVVYQRNHLLKSVRAGRSKPGELDFWNDELVSEGKLIMARRLETVEGLSELAGPIHRELAGDGEALALVYRPSTGASAGRTEEELAEVLRRSLALHRDREIANGFTTVGPHRDDIQILLDGMDVGLYASRGQCRTAVLSMKLAEARHVVEQRRQEPVLLLDDVLSELDAARRAHVLETAGQYEQCFVTTSDPELIDERFLSRMSRFLVHQGRVEPEAAQLPA